MTCKECVHNEVCKHKDYKEIGVLFTEKCDHFKPKSRFVELPCEVGDYLLWDNGKETVLKEVKGFSYVPSDLGLRFIIDGCTPVIGYEAKKRNPIPRRSRKCFARKE